MAIQPISPTRKIVKGKDSKPSGLGQFLQAAGGVAGGIVGGLTGGAPGAIAGAAGGSSLGRTIGGAIAPGTRGTADQVQFKPQVQLAASDEAIRGQQLLAGIQAANSRPGLASYAAPLTKAYIQSMINMKNMG